MSARAAWRLVSLAFPQVLRYTAGKADWSVYGLPTEGKSVTPNRVGNLARRDVPTCSLSDRADTIRQQLPKNGARLGGAVGRAQRLDGCSRDGSPGSPTAEQAQPIQSHTRAASDDPFEYEGMYLEIV